MSFFVSLALCVAACGPPAPPPPSQSEPQYHAAQAQALSALQRDFGELQVRLDPQLGTVARLEFSTPPLLPSSGSLATAVRELLLRYRPLFGLSASDAFDYVDSAADSLGMRHFKYAQKRAGIPIWGSHLSVHVRTGGAAGAGLGAPSVVRIHGHLYALPLLRTSSPQPALTAEAAKQQALADARGRAPASRLMASSPTLHYRAADGQLTLVYRLEVSGQSTSFPYALRWAYFIDAQSGAVCAVEDLVARLEVTVPAQGSGRGALGALYSLSVSQRGDAYYLQDPTRGDQRTASVAPLEKLPGKTVTSPRADRWDESPAAGGAAAGLAVDVHAHLATLWDYFAGRHGYFGWDGGGRGLVAVAHVGDRDNLAAFDGERLLFGDGDGRDYAPLGAALDIVAHEYVHAVSRKSANLAGEGESGALDEGIANLMACLVEQTVREKGGNWTIGEEIYHPSEGTPGEPAALVDLRKTENLVSYSGYLLTQSLGVERVAAIVFRALTVYLFRYAGDENAKDALVASAQDLYGEAAVAAVAVVWSIGKNSSSTGL